MPSVWIKAESTLEIYPERYPWIVEPPNVKPIWVIDQRSLNAWYWSDIVNRINTITFIYAAKLRDLFGSLERCLVENNLLLSALIFRSLLEYVASLNWSSVFISSRLNSLDIKSLDIKHYVDEEFEKELIRMTHGSRFNWNAYLKGQFDELVKKPSEVTDLCRQKNILGYIDKLARQKRYSSLRLIYDLLSEFVHPNFGSNLIYVTEEKETDIGVRILLGSTHTRSDTIQFLEPLIGALLSCCDITSRDLPEITNAIGPLSKWCHENYIYYVKKGKGL